MTPPVADMYKRQLVRIITWDDFLDGWKDVRTENEAIGILKSAGDVLKSTQEIPGQGYITLREDMVAFFLDLITETNNDRIRQFAQKIICRKILPHLTGTLALNQALHTRVCEFLVSQPAVICTRPYPRIIRMYLTQVWDARRPQRFPNLELHPMEGTLYFQLVFAMLKWGMGNILAEGGLEEAIPTIGAYLETYEIDFLDAIFNIFELTDEDIDDFSFQAALEQAKLRAAAAYIKQMMWVGGGITLKYEHTILQIKK